MRWSVPGGCWAWMLRLAGMRCSSSWSRRGSSSLASKLDSLRVLEEAGVAAASYPTVNRRLRVYAKDSWRQQISAACAAHARLGPASLVLFDVSTLLCRRRHNSVYADLVVMPMSGGLLQVIAFCWFRKSAY